MTKCIQMMRFVILHTFKFALSFKSFFVFFK